MQEKEGPTYQGSQKGQVGFGGKLGGKLGRGQRPVERFFGLQPRRG